MSKIHLGYGNNLQGASIGSGTYYFGPSPVFMKISGSLFASAFVLLGVFLAIKLLAASPGVLVALILLGLASGACFAMGACIPDRTDYEGLNFRNGGPSSCGNTWSCGDSESDCDSVSSFASVWGSNVSLDERGRWT